MASPALEIAQKTKDVGLQLWAALLIAGNWLVLFAGKAITIVFKTCSGCLVT